MEQNSKVSKNFFLISFLPAIAYWYLEDNYPLRIAIFGGVILGVLEIVVEWFFTKHIHTISKFNLVLIIFLGALSFLGEEGIWFKLQPAFTGIGVFSFLLYRLFRGHGMLYEMMESFNQGQLPPYPIIRSLEFHVAILFGIYGSFMIFIALYASTDLWLFFKTLGFYIVFIVFMVFEFFLMRFKIKKQAEFERKKAMLASFDGRKF